MAAAILRTAVSLKILNLFESDNAARLRVSNLEKIPELGR